MTIDEAAAALRAGGVVAMPTETVYGLAANALDPAAVARVFAIKRRPTQHPLIVHLASSAQLEGWAMATPEAHRLAERFWPGPLTLILPRGPLALDAVTGGLDTVGVRVPAHPVALALIARFGGGVAAPSANRFGRVSPTRAEHVEADLAGEEVGLVDGGPCEVGIESTIVDLSGSAPTLLRLGAISPEAIAEALDRPVSRALHAALGLARAPGQLQSHYAPRAHLELVARDALEARRAELLAMGQGPVATLAEALGDTPHAWARSLYAALREADAASPRVILVAHPPEGPLAEAVADRLQRAAAPR